MSKIHKSNGKGGALCRPGWPGAREGEAEVTCGLCLRAKSKKPSVTASCPGVREIAAATGYALDVVRDLAGVPGCPTVKGGRGYRFVSVDAVMAWIGSMTLEQKLRVKPLAHVIREALVEEIAKFVWAVDAAEWTRMRRLPYAELVALRDHWKAMDATDAKRRIRGPLVSCDPPGLVRDEAGLPKVCYL